MRHGIRMARQVNSCVNVQARHYVTLSMRVSTGGSNCSLPGILLDVFFLRRWAGSGNPDECRIAGAVQRSTSPPRQPTVVLDYEVEKNR